jgi:hypothetical protein
MSYLLTLAPARLSSMADNLDSLVSNFQSLPAETKWDHTQVDLCDRCARAFIQRDEPIALSYHHTGDTSVRICTICRSPAKRWTVETINE